MARILDVLKSILEVFYQIMFNLALCVVVLLENLRIQLLKKNHQA